ncbi:ABC transporter permease [Leisingera sp.]|uniref:ABC transporter permease n=1 Tax=Leisingera sp. TaxID=1879318 RepID=UPI002B26909E|nr:ABC transporter permease [Leisingera sp.]
MDTLVFVLAGAFATATPLLLAALGELVVEKSGVINLSVEGMMAVAAVIAFVITYTSGSHLLGFVGGALAAMLLSLIFAVLVLVFSANQVASGLAVGILGLGMSALLGRSYESFTLTAPAKITVPVLSNIPLVGPILFQQDLVVYLTIAASAGLIWFMQKSRNGLVLRVIGEDPHIAHNLGFRVLRTRFLAILFGGFMAGLAGAYAATVLTPVWSQGMIVGRGWIALALVVFGTWRVLRVVIGAYIFGALLLADLAVQSLDIGIPSQVMTSMPYLMTILVLALVSRDALRIKLNAPVALGENYRPAH